MSDDKEHKGSAFEVFSAFLLLGLTSFGGPIAHLGYFRTAFVTNRKWLDDKTYADLVALCQFMPGPASSQVGIAIGQLRAGPLGALAAWVAFTAPSVILMVLFAWGLQSFGALSQGYLSGLKIAALAVVTQALWGMAKSLTPDTPRRLIAAGAAIIMLIMPDAWMQVLVIAISALIGAFLLQPPAPGATTAQEHRLVSKSTALVCLGIFFALLLGLPLLANLWPDNLALALFDGFYRTGSLVFGGGHVVLPLLDAETVQQGLVSDDAFLAGYGAAQAVPGPLFSFAAYLGAMINGPVTGIAGALLCLVAVYVPSFLLVFGMLPFWHGLKSQPRAAAALIGANAGVVGLLAAALYNPVFTSAVASPLEMALAIAAFVALTTLRTPPWLLVVAMAFIGGVLLS